MTIERTIGGINKAGDIGTQIGFAERCGGSSRRRWRAISNFVAGFARRLCATEVQ